MARLPARISPMRCAGTPISFAVVAHAQGLQELLGQHLAGRHGFEFPAHVDLRQ
jgi:hypothetical protein